MTTLVTRKELNERLASEEINPRNVIVCEPRWAESAPLTSGVKSRLVRTDLIVRSDGSGVALDGMVGIDSMSLWSRFSTNPPDEIEFDAWCDANTLLPAECRE